jgi:hypothetical protein
MAGACRDKLPSMTSVAPIVDFAPPEPKGTASPAGPSASWIVAALLSIVAPGPGHVYARHTRRGVLWLAATIGLAVIVPASM